MAEQDIKIQISELNQKLDLILESIEQQQRNREEFDDLVKDVNIVTKDVFKQTVIMLDKSQVELDQCSVSELLVKVLQNLGNFRDLLDLIESASDFMKDLSPILHQMGLDAVNKMNELDQKGYFEYFRELVKVSEKFMLTFPVEEIRRINENMDQVTGIIRDLTQPELLKAIHRTTQALNSVKADPKLDDVSIWKLFIKMRSPEVRKSLSYTLRLIENINK